jgi:hypothetical protein
MAPHPQMFDDDDPLLARLSALALAYPDAAMKVSHGRPAFFTTKVFAYFGGSEKRDGEWIRHDACVMVLPDELERPLLTEDTRTFVPAYLGPSGWLGFQLPAPDAPADAWDEVDDLLESSYRRTAGARRIARLEAERG